MTFWLLLALLAVLIAGLVMGFFAGLRMPSYSCEMCGAPEPVEDDEATGRYPAVPGVRQPENKRGARGPWPPEPEIE